MAVWRNDKLWQGPGATAQDPYVVSCMYKSRVKDTHGLCSIHDTKKNLISGCATQPRVRKNGDRETPRRFKNTNLSFVEQQRERSIGF
jgi:hypothetical protein